MSRFLWSLTVLIGFLSLSTYPSPAMARTIRPNDISVPDGYRIEAVANDLAAPTMVAFDDQGRMLIAESGYDGSGGPRVTRTEKDGKRTRLTKDGVFGQDVPVTAIAVYQGKVYVVHAGTVSSINNDGSLQNLITGLPGRGDHQANQLVFKDGKMYLGIGTVTNSAVVGPDNAVFGWLNRPENKDLHDVPCQDITLSNNATFHSAGVSGHNLPETNTSAYAAFGQTQPAGTVIKGNVKCNGAILTANPDGSNLQVYAWGFRNPYGLQFGPDGALYVSMHGFDARGSRPIENAWDCVYKVESGAWYGWPDFACDMPVTDSRFKPKDQPQPQFILQNHPASNPPKPIAKFPPHAATNGFAFAINGWGKPTDIFIALFGDFTPATGTVSSPQGVKVVRLDTASGKVSDFSVNKVPGQASRNNGGGLEHPSSVTFGPDGAMYIADWGIARVSVDGLKLDPDSGVIWKISRNNSATATSTTPFPSGPALLLNILLTVALAAITYLLLRGTRTGIGWASGLGWGVIAGLVMGLATLIISKVALDLPWFAPPRVLATLVLGPSALANILTFDLLSFVVGLIVVLTLGALLGLIFTWLLRSDTMLLGAIFYALTVWALLQFFVFPLIDPLITEKGFPPFWYAVSFAVYGVALGVLLQLFSSRKSESSVI